MNLGNTIKNSKDILDYSNTKHNIITNNLANINNPNYKRKFIDDISFENTFKDTLKVTNEKHIQINNKSNSEEKIHTDPSKGRNDNNNVDLDKELIDLNSNQYLFELNSIVLKTEYNKLLEAII